MRDCEEKFGKCDVKMDFMANDLIKNLVAELKQQAGFQESGSGDMPSFDRNALLFGTNSRSTSRRPVQKVGKQSMGQNIEY